MPEPLTPEEVGILVQHIRDLRAENERLRSDQPLLSVLRELALDPTVPAHVRLRAAEAGVQYETPKLSASVSQIGISRMNIGERMDEAHRRLREAEQRGLRIVENDPDPLPPAA
jgi:hypothetical protein